MRYLISNFLLIVTLLIFFVPVLSAESDSTWNWRESAEAMDSDDDALDFPWNDPNEFEPYSKIYVAFGVNQGVGIDYYGVNWKNSFIVSGGFVKRFTERLGFIGAITLKRLTGHTMNLNMLSLDFGAQFYAAEQLVSPYVSCGLSPTYHWINDIDDTETSSIGAYVGLGLEMGNRRMPITNLELRFNLIFTGHDGIGSLPLMFALKF